MEMEGESSQLRKQVDQLESSVTGLIAKYKEQESKTKFLEKLQFDTKERLKAQEVRGIINKMQYKYSTDCFELNKFSLKKLECVIVPILTKLTNTCIDERSFPPCLKQAIIVAVHKRGDVQEPSHFRPISLLPTVAKSLKHTCTTNHLIFGSFWSQGRKSIWFQTTKWNNSCFSAFCWKRYRHFIKQAKVVDTVFYWFSRDSKNVLKINLTENRIKACHTLPETANGDQYDSVICKFVYFDEKDSVWCKTKVENWKKTAWTTNLFSWLNDYQSLKLQSGLRQIDRASSLRQNFFRISVLVKRNSNDTGDHINLRNVKNPIKRDKRKKKFCHDVKGNTATTITKLMMIERIRWIKIL